MHGVLVYLWKNWQRLLLLPPRPGRTAGLPYFKFVTYFTVLLFWILRLEFAPVTAFCIYSNFLEPDLRNGQRQFFRRNGT